MTVDRESVVKGLVAFTLTQAVSIYYVHDSCAGGLIYAQIEIEILGKGVQKFFHRKSHGEML